jgi:hypothetical protein
LLADLLPDIESASSITVHAKERIVKIKTSDGDVPLNNLSLGYKTMIAWSVDLALKMLSRHSESENPLSEPAIVIIDEVDLHLHPQWQRILRTKLTTHFPNTQFICTAHSPFMAQDSEDENLCVLQRDENNENQVNIENNPLIVKGWRIGQIVTSELFGLSSDRAVDEEKDIEERRILIDKSRRTQQEEERLRELNEKISGLPVTETEDEKLLKQIRKAAQLLKEKGIIDDQD